MEQMVTESAVLYCTAAHKRQAGARLGRFPGCITPAPPAGPSRKKSPHGRCPVIDDGWLPRHRLPPLGQQARMLVQRPAGKPITTRMGLSGKAANASDMVRAVTASRQTPCPTRPGRYPPVGTRGGGRKGRTTPHAVFVLPCFSGGPLGECSAASSWSGGVTEATAFYPELPRCSDGVAGVRWRPA